jgi:hypothetical protein
VNGDRLALAELDAVAVFDQELGPALADSVHLVDRVLEKVTFVSAVAAVGRWEDEGGHWMVFAVELPIFTENQTALLCINNACIV